MKAKSTDVAFTEISKEFAETFGYIRQDIAAIRRANLSLNYTSVLLICCACDMLAWHKDVDDHEIFTSLLPDGEPYTSLGEKVFEAVRNGLAHRFRPNTIKIGNELWRFRFSWQHGSPVSVSRGKMNWLGLNTKYLEDRVTAQIDAYERELQNSAPARLKFVEKGKKSISVVPCEAKGILAGLNSL